MAQAEEKVGENDVHTFAQELAYHSQCVSCVVWILGVELSPLVSADKKKDMLWGK